MGEREKSALYPAVTIEDCIEFVRIVDAFKSRTVAYRAVADKRIRCVLSSTRADLLLLFFSLSLSE